MQGRFLSAGAVRRLGAGAAAASKESNKGSCSIFSHAMYP